VGQSIFSRRSYGPREKTCIIGGRVEVRLSDKDISKASSRGRRVIGGHLWAKIVVKSSVEKSGSLLFLASGVHVQSRPRGKSWGSRRLPAFQNRKKKNRKE